MSIIEKIKDFVSELTDGEKKFILALNVVFLILFYFIGIPGGKGILTYVIGFIVVELFYLVAVYFVKTKF